MKNQFFSWILGMALVLGTQTVLLAQNDGENPPIWETIMLTPDHTKLKTLGENMRKHNQKYHADGPHQASVYNIQSGPHTGKMVWIMGPLKFADIDARPAEGGHDEDWRDNIMPHLKKIEQGEYWQLEAKPSNIGMLEGDPGNYPVLFTRYWEFNIDHSHNADRMLKQIGDAVKAMEGDNPWGVYNNLFRQGDIGRHLATVSFHKSWSELDEDPTFMATYKKTHGEDSWDAFIRDMDQLLDNSWDEIWVYDKNLSGD